MCDNQKSILIECVENVSVDKCSYDELNEREQAIVRSEIGERMEVRRQSLDVEAEFRAQGIGSWVSTDSDGNVILRGPDHE